jgi:hypothetical protein
MLFVMTSNIDKSTKFIYLSLIEVCSITYCCYSMVMARNSGKMTLSKNLLQMKVGFRSG